MVSELQIEGLGSAADGAVGATPKVEPSSRGDGRQRSRRLRSETVIAVVSPLVLLALWELAAAVGVVDARFLPPPSRLVEEFVQGVRSGQLLRDTGLSLYRIGAGFVIGGTAGVLVGALMGMSATLRGLVGPLLSAMYSVPKTALLPLMILLFGFSETSKITLLAISAFFLTQVNTVHGVLTIPKVLFEVARDCGVSRWRFIRTVAIPGALPYIIAGLRLSWTVALIVVVFVEMKATTGGLGASMMTAWRLFEIDRMMVALVVLAAIGLVSNLLFDAAARWLVPWKAGQQR